MPVSLLGTLLFFALGLVLIVKGGDLFVDAAVWIAEASGVPQFIIGATVVSLATTLPELMVSSLGVLRGEVDLAVGNAVGSVTANTGLIMGLSILCLPAVIRRREFAAKGALLLAAALALALLCRDGRLTAGSGLVLLAIFAAFGWENLRAAGRSGGGRTAAGAKGRLGGQLVKFLLNIHQHRLGHFAVGLLIGHIRVVSPVIPSCQQHGFQAADIRVQVGGNLFV